jgi:hypothetical protein
MDIPVTQIPHDVSGNNEALAFIKKGRNLAKSLLLYAVLLAFWVAFGIVVAAYAGIDYSSTVWVGDSQSDWLMQHFEVLVLPNSNTKCTEADLLNDDLEAPAQYCVVYACSNNRRCGLGGFSESRMSSKEGRMCFLPNEATLHSGENSPQIYGVTSSYRKRITTYKLTCEAGGSSTACLQYDKEKFPSLCSSFWPTLESVISKDIQSPGSMLDPTGSYRIQGAYDDDPNIWFNMCGFCSFFPSLQLCAPHNRTHAAAFVFICDAIRPLFFLLLPTVPFP